jgi:hypothetical protein
MIRNLKKHKLRTLIFVFLLAITFSILDTESKAQQNRENLATVLPIAKYPWDHSMVNGIVWNDRICSLFGIPAEASAKDIDLAKLLAHMTPGAEGGTVERLDMEKLPEIIVLCFVYSADVQKPVGNEDVMLLLEYPNLDIPKSPMLTEIPIGFPLRIKYVERELSSSKASSPKVGIPVSIEKIEYFGERTEYFGEGNYLSVSAAGRRMKPAPYMPEYEFHTVGIVNSYVTLGDDVYMLLKQYEFSGLSSEVPDGLLRTIFPRRMKWYCVPVKVTDRGKYPMLGSIVHVGGTARSLPSNRLISMEEEEFSWDPLEMQQAVDPSFMEVLRGREISEYVLDNNLLNIDYDRINGFMMNVFWSDGGANDEFVSDEAMER